MKTYKLIATVTAVLLTLASMSAVNYNVAVQRGATSHARLAHVTNLAPVYVYPSADELRQASLSAVSAPANTILAAASPANEDNASASFKLVGSALTVPHYSFSRTFGRISKE